MNDPAIGTSDHSRPYDLILFGATGFTGRLVAEYLDRRQEIEGFTWAIAGRDPVKLDQLAGTLTHPPGIVIADTGNRTSVEQMTAQARIVINTAGPFAWFGEPVVSACLTSGTHYMDITGEPSFIRDMRSRYHDEALSRGVTIIHCCGFDSIPADLGTRLTVRALPAEGQKEVVAYLRTQARFSGGTWTTAIQGIHRHVVEGKPASRPVNGPKRAHRRVPLRIHRIPDSKRWAIPMPVVDPHVIKATSSALPEEFGPEFVYGQFYTVGSFWRMVRLVLPIAMIFLLVRFATTRAWLFRKFPPGSGPSPEQRDQSRFEFILHGWSSGQQVITRVAGGDPGYTETAKMLGESAFTLLHQIREHRSIPGIRTPAHALGMELVARLRDKGIRMEVHPQPNDPHGTSLTWRNERPVFRCSPSLGISRSGGADDRICQGTESDLPDSDVQD